jgi:hypothetical protein
MSKRVEMGKAIYLYSTAFSGHYVAQGQTMVTVSQKYHVYLIEKHKWSCHFICIVVIAMY